MFSNSTFTASIKCLDWKILKFKYSNICSIITNITGKLLNGPGYCELQTVLTAHSTLGHVIFSWLYILFWDGKTKCWYVCRVMAELFTCHSSINKWMSLPMILLLLFTKYFVLHVNQTSNTAVCQLSPRIQLCC